LVQGQPPTAKPKTVSQAWYVAGWQAWRRVVLRSSIANAQQRRSNAALFFARVVTAWLQTIICNRMVTNNIIVA